MTKKSVDLNRDLNCTVHAHTHVRVHTEAINRNINLHRIIHVNYTSICLTLNTIQWQCRRIRSVIWSTTKTHTDISAAHVTLMQLQKSHISTVTRIQDAVNMYNTAKTVPFWPASFLPQTIRSLSSKLSHVIYGRNILHRRTIQQLQLQSMITC